MDATSELQIGFCDCTFAKPYIMDKESRGG